jgi:ABC-type proline/glycine betaine transport system permease subunit
VRQVDPDIIDATGIGMTGAGILWRVEVPMSVRLMAGGMPDGLRVGGRYGHPGRRRVLLLYRHQHLWRASPSIAMSRSWLCGLLVVALALITELALGTAPRLITPAGVRTRRSGRIASTVSDI